MQFDIHIENCDFLIFPHILQVGFKSSRFYWSMRRLYKRCRYVCSISDNEGNAEFTIRVVEAGFEDIVMKDNSPRSVWFKVLEPLDKMRRNADLVKIFPSFMTGEELFGLTEPAIIRVIESVSITYKQINRNTNQLSSISQIRNTEMTVSSFGQAKKKKVKSVNLHTCKCSRK